MPEFFDAYAKADSKGLGDNWERLSARLTSALDDISAIIESSIIAL